MNNIYIIYIFLISFGIGIIKYNLKKITNIIKNRNLKYNLIQQDDDKNYKLFNTDEFELNNYITENGINNQNNSIINNNSNYYNQDYIEDSLNSTTSTTSTIDTDKLYLNKSLFDSELYNNLYTSVSSNLYNYQDNNINQHNNINQDNNINHDNIINQDNNINQYNNINQDNLENSLFI